MTTHDHSQPPSRRHLRSVPAPQSRGGGRPSPIAVRNETDLLALIPYTFGFHPQRSLVLMVLGDSGRPMFARIDLPADQAEADAATTELLHAAVTNGGRRALLVAYTDDEAEAFLVTEQLADELSDAGFEVLSVLRADGRRWWRLLPPGSSTDDGIPYDVTSHPITATGVVEGRVTHRSREQLAETLLPHDPDRLEAVAAAHASMGPLPGDRAGLRAEALWLEEWTTDHAGSSSPGLAEVGADEIARVVRALSHAELRDVAWAGMSRETADAHVRLWTAIVVQCPLDLLAPVAGLLAFAAWLSGHGALAWCAIDRSLSSDPDHTLARLVADTLDGAMPPSVWRPIPRSSLSLLTG